MIRLLFILGLQGLALVMSAQKGTDPQGLAGRYEGVLTQDAGGVVPEYRMVLVIREEGAVWKGYVEVWYGEEIYVKHEVQGQLQRGFFLELEDGRLLNRKELKGKLYCEKTYQLAFSRIGDSWQLKGRWQGRTSEGPCVPGQILLTRSRARV